MKIFTLLILLFLIKFTYSQIGSVDKEGAVDVKQMMSFNVTIALLGQYGLEYELRLNDRFTFWANGGMVGRYAFFNYRENIGFKFIEPSKMRNFAGGGFKYYYPGVFDGFNALVGINRINLSSEKFMATELGVSSGYQFNIIEKFSVDLSLVGMFKFANFSRYSESYISSVNAIPLINAKICKNF